MRHSRRLFQATDLVDDRVYAKESRLSKTAWSAAAGRLFQRLGNERATSPPTRGQLAGNRLWVSAGEWTMPRGYSA
jgi:hypothetical protein